MTVIAVFRSRAQALDFLSRLHGLGAQARAIATPACAGVGCGLSVRFDASAADRARALVRGRGYSSFAGLWRYTAEGCSRL